MKVFSKPRAGDHLQSVAAYFFLGVVCFLALAPILWTVSTSLKPTGEIVSYPPKWIPERLESGHYLKVFRSRMPLYILNSLIISIGTILLTLLIASHAAYAISRFNFRLKNLYMFFILATMMMPGVATLVPVYIIASRLGILDTPVLLILVYSAWLVPETIWLLRGFFDTVPSSLDKAAMIDGYSRWYAFYRVALPLIAPGIAAAAVLVFVYVWNEFIIALTLTSSDHMRTAQVGLHYYVTVFGVEWGELTAAIVVSLIPAVALFLVFQRRFVRGMLSGAIKG